MDIKYKWKNGAPPTRDEAARSEHLLDESQFNSEHDRHMAEQDARKHLGVPTDTTDSGCSILPQAAPEADVDME